MLISCNDDDDDVGCTQCDVKSVANPILAGGSNDASGFNRLVCYKTVEGQMCAVYMDRGCMKAVSRILTGVKRND
jgi:hypothetical protein